MPDAAPRSASSRLRQRRRHGSGYAVGLRRQRDLVQPDVPEPQLVLHLQRPDRGAQCLPRIRQHRERHRQAPGGRRVPGERQPRDRRTRLHRRAEHRQLLPLLRREPVLRLPRRPSPPTTAVARSNSAGTSTTRPRATRSASTCWATPTWSSRTHPWPGRPGLWYWNTQSGPGTMTAHNAMVDSAGSGETIRFDQRVPGVQRRQPRPGAEPRRQVPGLRPDPRHHARFEPELLSHRVIDPQRVDNHPAGRSPAGVGQWTAASEQRFHGHQEMAVRRAGRGALRRIRPLRRVVPGRPAR